VSDVTVDITTGETIIIEREVTEEEKLELIRSEMECTPAQMRITLLRLGMLEKIEAIAYSDPEAAIYWEYALRFERNSPYIKKLLTGTDLTEADVDNLFLAAMQV